jgi:cytochrome c-type biogenesis protein CcmH/NrfG
MSCFKQATLAVLFLGISWAASFAGAEVGDDELLAEGRVDEAIASLQKRVSSNETDAQSYNLLCRAYYSLDSWDAAIEACQKAVALSPSISQYHLWLGRAYGEKASHSKFVSAAGLAKKVRSEFETAVKLDPNNIDARSDLADFYIEAPGVLGGGKDKAEAQAAELAALDPAEGDLVLARIAEKKNDILAAETEYRGAILASNGKAGPWLSLAEFYARVKRFDQMQDAIQHAVSAQNNEHVLVPAAEVLVRTRQDLTEAVQLLRRYLDKDTVEDDPAFRARFLLGTLLEKQGETESAVQQYRAALSLARNFSPAERALNRIYRHNGQDRVAARD